MCDGSSSMRWRYRCTAVEVVVAAAAAVVVVVVEKEEGEEGEEEEVQRVVVWEGREAKITSCD
jgi:hypothetical protein